MKTTTINLCYYNAIPTDPPCQIGNKIIPFAYRLENKPARDDDFWGGQTDYSATARSASHPELYIVGQALYRD